ncbi:MAG: hypothetical protein H7242_05075 [Microbacteriaceae bacterium]|nr:hypothetical protein [Burkholderiaceae bacterium]
MPNNAGGTTYHVTIGSARTATLDIEALLNNLTGGGSIAGNSTLSLGAGHTLTVNGKLTAGVHTLINGCGALTLAGGGASESNAQLFLDDATFNNAHSPGCCQIDLNRT